MTTLKKAARPAPATARRRRRGQTRRFFVVSHRWLSLSVGLMLLLITTSGAVVLYESEITRFLNREAYAATPGGSEIGYDAATAAVGQAYPDFVPTDVILEHGVYRVTDYRTSYTVDPVTGSLLGEVAPAPDWLSIIENMHYCLMSCPDYTGHVSLLDAEVPGTGWLGHEAQVTVGELLLGLLAVALVYLTLSGLWLWFPRPGRWKAGLSIRWRRGRFARDTDLHRVIGIAALLPLLVWGYTGVGFEFEPVETAWFAVTPGPAPEEAPAAVATPAPGQNPMSQDAALAAALAAHPDLDPVSVSVLPVADPTAVYSLWMSGGFDPYGRSEFPGDVGLTVDPYTADVQYFYGSPDRPAGQTIWDDWNYPVHAGMVVNGWWRLLWLGMGLTPLALALTGVSTWLVRRRTARRRGSARALKSSPA